MKNKYVKRANIAVSQMVIDAETNRLGELLVL
jgi:hypothetical protein